MQLISKLPSSNSTRGSAAAAGEGKAGGATAWYVTVDADGAGNEALVAAALTPAQARNSSVAAAPAAAARSSLWFHIRLQDHCQTLS